MAFCTVCGNPSDDNAQFCATCGTRASAAAAPTPSATCATCGASVQGVRFCTGCGAPVNAVQARELVGVAAGPPTAPVVHASPAVSQTPVLPPLNAVPESVAVTPPPPVAAEAPEAATALEPATFGAKVVALLIDWLIAGAGTAIAFAFIQQMAAIAPLMYFVGGEGLGGKTLGKRILGIRVVRLGGGDCGYGRALVRNLLFVVDALPYVVPGLIGVLTALNTRNKQRVGDLVAGTMVVKG